MNLIISFFVAILMALSTYYVAYLLFTAELKTRNKHIQALIWSFNRVDTKIVAKLQSAHFMNRPIRWKST